VSQIDVSVVLPVFNERDHLAAEVERVVASLRASTYAFEILVVDDGSTDGSHELARELERQVDELRVIRFEANRGSGWVRKVGTRSARGDIVVWTDVDMTYPNGDIPELVDQMAGHDQVVGARRTEEGTHKALRVPAKWAIRKLASYLVETDIPDLNSGFRAFRRDVALQFLHLLPAGFSCVTTITLAFLSHGYSVHYVPIDYAPRAGESKFHWWKDTKRYVIQVIRMSMTFNPLRLFLPLSLWLFVLGTAKLAYDWIVRDFSLSSNTLLLFLIAFNVASIGLLADAIARLSRRREEEVAPAVAGPDSADLRAGTR